MHDGCQPWLHSFRHGTIRKRFSEANPPENQAVNEQKPRQNRSFHAAMHPKAHPAGAGYRANAMRQT